MTQDGIQPQNTGFDLGESRGRMHEEHTSLLKTADVAVSLQGLAKHFGDITAVKDLDMDIRAGEFFSITSAKPALVNAS